MVLGIICIPPLLLGKSGQEMRQGPGGSYGGTHGK